MALETFGKILHAIRKFRTSQLGNVAITFALAALPLTGAVGAGVDFATAMKDKSAMQSALDSAALAVVKSGGTASAQSWFNASFTESGVSHITVTSTYDSTKLKATVSATGTYATALLKTVGVQTIPLSGTATAEMKSAKWPVCVDVTATASNHTLLTENSAHINFNDCMVQVNTNNWDAVEGRDTSYIHSTNGDNCFVGDIHYGDITPAKDTSCTFFTDPFANYAMPSSASNCDHTSMAVTTTTTLSPGTYCSGLTISANTTLNPGLYIITNGYLTISGGTVTGNGVTFLFTGASSTSGFIFSGTSNITLSPATSGVGNFAGFVFYYDTASAASCKDPGDGSGVKAPVTGGKIPKGGTTTCTSAIEGNANVTLSGITYLVGQSLLITGYAQVTVNPGSLSANLLVAESNANVSLTGALDTSTASEIAMQKSGSGSEPVLIQ